MGMLATWRFEMLIIITSISNQLQFLEQEPIKRYYPALRWTCVRLKVNMSGDNSFVIMQPQVYRHDLICKKNLFCLYWNYTKQVLMLLVLS